MNRREAELYPPRERHAPGETAGQDVNDQSWDPAFDGAMGFEEGHRQDGVRTLSGLIDLGLDVVDEVTHVIEHDGGKHEHEHMSPRVLPTQAIPSDAVRMDTIAVSQNGTKLVEKRDDRLRVVITNTGPDPLYVSHGNPNGSTTMGVYPLAANQSQEFRTRAEIWGGVAAGKSALAAIVDEYGYVSTC